MADPFIDSKTFQLIWYQLTKRGWTFRKSVGLSNDQRYVPPDGNVKGTEGVDVFVGERSLVKHCMQQGWLSEYLTQPPGVPLRSSTPQHTTPPVSTTPSATAPDVVEAPATPSVAVQPSLTAAKPVKWTPRTAAKATKVSSSHAKSTRTPAAGKRKAAPKSAREKRHRTDEAVAEESQRVPDIPEVLVPDAPEIVTDNDHHAVPDVLDDVLESDEDGVPDGSQKDATRHARDPRFVSLDDFDSDNFLTALRRDRLFEPLDSDDLNRGEADRLLELDSEAEGDEDTIVVEKDIDNVSDEELTAYLCSTCGSQSLTDCIWKSGMSTTSITRATCKLMLRLSMMGRTVRRKLH